MGFNVPSRTTAFDAYEMRHVGWPHDFMNKYNPFAILNELRWALDPAHEFPTEALVGLAPGKWYDPHATTVFGPVPRETALEQHATLTSLVSRIPSCRIVIITLGLIEAWFDVGLELYTNSTPALVDEPLERFRFRVLRYDEVMQALAEIHETLTAFGHEDTEIVVTVSPVPLNATFTGEDIVVANTHSKALLRAAAAEWAASFQNVHYFPSFEIVMNSDRATTWRMDGRHVRAEAVAHIMDTFVEAYVERGEAETLSLAASHGSRA